MPSYPGEKARSVVRFCFKNEKDLPRSRGERGAGEVFLRFGVFLAGRALSVVNSDRFPPQRLIRFPITRPVADSFHLAGIVLLALTGLLLAARGSTRAAEDPRPWWLTPRRMVQTNLREIDATMDLDRYLRDLQDWRAQVVLFNVGGIVANYPTDLENHFRNPLMKGDLTDNVLNRLHGAGIRVIGRFDFSKVNQSIAERHPEWLYVSEKGQHVNYNGQMHTCVSGGYQQEYMFQILGEAVDRYPLDGVFFNMIGFTRSDYSGNYHGICQCENCRRRFRESSGMELPATRSESRAYDQYVKWTRTMVDQQFTRVRSFLKEKRPDLCICTYTSEGIDVIRKESNTPLGRGTYSDSDKAKYTLLTCGERQLANCAVHFVRIPHRHAAVSPYLSARRVWQMMVNGAWLDFYCIGPLQRQEDRTGLDEVRDLYRFHSAHEKYFASSQPAGQIGVVRRAGDEYTGIVQILSENHIAYELCTLQPASLRTFSLVIVPSAGGLDANETKSLDDYVHQGGKIILTGRVPETLTCLGPLKLIASRDYPQGAYIRLRPEDKRVLSDSTRPVKQGDPQTSTVLPDQLGPQGSSTARSSAKRPILNKLDLVFLRGQFHTYQFEPPTDGLLRLIPPGMFGPPEKCYYTEVSDRPALLRREYGRGHAACLTFGVGKHYHDQAHAGHAALVTGTIDNVLNLSRRVVVDTSPLVEINHRRDADGRFEWVGLYNHSGHRGNAFHEPIPIHSVAIDLIPTASLRCARSLFTGEELPLRKTDTEQVRVVLPELQHYDVVVFEYAAD